MKDEQRIKVLEDEVKVLKSEIKIVLLDLREQYLNGQNPFNQSIIPVDNSICTNPETSLSSKESVRDPEISIKIEEKAVNSKIMPVDIPNLGNQANELSSNQVSVPNYMPNTSDRAQGNAQMLAQNYMPYLSGRAQGSGQMPVQNYHSNPSDYEQSNGHMAAQQYLMNPYQKRESNDVSEMMNSFTAMPQNVKRQSDQEFNTGVGKVDLVVIAGLTKWIEQSAVKLGKERTEILLEMAFAMGRIPEKLKDALTKMLRISPYDSQEQSAAASDYLATLAQLDSLLTNTNQQDNPNALLSILSMMKETNHG